MTDRGRLINAAASAGARVVDAEAAIARVPKNAMHRIAERLQLEWRVASAKADLETAKAALALEESPRPHPFIRLDQPLDDDEIVRLSKIYAWMIEPYDNTDPLCIHVDDLAMMAELLRAIPLLVGRIGRDAA